MKKKRYVKAHIDDILILRVVAMLSAHMAKMERRVAKIEKYLRTLN